jgi:hypothetical protein
VVFELDHRLILLEPFQTRHKGNFARSPAFNCMGPVINVAALTSQYRCGSAACAVQLGLNGFKRDEFAHFEQTNTRRG